MMFSYFRFMHLGGLRTDISVDCRDVPDEDKLSHVIRRAVAATLAYERVRGKIYVSVTVCTPEHIHELNREYRDKDSETDVLSFPLWERDERPTHGRVELGDIVISYDRAAQQAAELGHGTLRECAFLAVHSTLHLLGYDHELSEEDDRDMCDRQKAIIAELDIEE